MSSCVQSCPRLLSLLLSVLLLLMLLWLPLLKLQRNAWIFMVAWNDFNNILHKYFNRCRNSRAQQPKLISAYTVCTCASDGMRPLALLSSVLILFALFSLYLLLYLSRSVRFDCVRWTTVRGNVRSFFSVSERQPNRSKPILERERKKESNTSLFHFDIPCNSRLAVAYSFAHCGWTKCNKMQIQFCIDYFDLV